MEHKKNISLVTPPQGSAAISRGAARVLANLDYCVVSELTLANGRRADLVGLDRRGGLLIVEVKSSSADFRSDGKWPEYRAYCDAFAFAVGPAFPSDLLPPDTGLIIADAYGGEIVRHPPLHPLSAARRKAMLLRFARIAAGRLAATLDPLGG